MEIYGLDFGQLDPVRIEMHMIRAGGYIDIDGERYGEGLFHHYKALQMLLWQEGEDHHRWSDLMLQEILNNRITVLAGARDTGKTHVGLARFGLTDYFVFPDNTLILISSTDTRGLQLRIFGDIKDLLSRAKERYPWLPGYAVESLLGIFTDKLDPQERLAIRDMRKGIICVPCVGGDGEHLEGLEKYLGIKQTRRKLLGDEVQFMDASYLNTLSNLDKGDFKGVFAGNFLGRGDPLDQLAEPKKGWGSIGDPKKTIVWDNLKGGRTVNLVGMDSPNFDYPQDQPSRYPYLIDRHDVERVRERYGEDSLQYWSQIKGVRKSDLMAHRILTVDLCRKCGAFNTDTWEGPDITKIYSMDAAFGGDRPMHGHIEFGRNSIGRWIIRCLKPEAVKLRISDELSVEDQLALAMKAYCDMNGIPPQNVYYDAGMRATLAVAIARIFSSQCNAINFGGPATDRPVSADDFIYDEKEKKRRLKTCKEAYSKFVTELNYSVRMVVEAKQMREIPESVVREFEMREWCKVSGDRIELETKAETKKRMGQSPDMADWCFEAGTLIETPSGPRAIETVREGDLVITPFGTTWVHRVRVRQVTDLSYAKCANGSEIRGMGEHKIFTWDKGWVRLDCITIDNELESIDNLWRWRLLNALFTKDESTTFKALVDIIKTVTTGRFHARDFFIGCAGLSDVGLFQKACASIIGMGIGRIMRSPILSLFPTVSTQPFTCASACGIRNSGDAASGIFSPRPFQQQLNGTDLPKDSSGTRNILRKCAQDGKSDASHAPNAERRLKNTRRGALGIFALCAAEIKTLCAGINRLIASVVCVGVNLFRTSIETRGPVLRSVEHLKLQKPVSVYDLTLGEHNAYYANGLLVSNCAIAVEGARRRGFMIEGIKETGSIVEQEEEQWLEKALQKFKTFESKYQLRYNQQK